MKTIKAGAAVKVRKIGGSLKATPYTLTREVVVANVRQWATFGGVAWFIGEASGWEIEFGDDDTAEYAPRLRGVPSCKKCHGRGYLAHYDHVQGGKCFSCGPASI